jgi:hypothetical protein
MVERTVLEVISIEALSIGASGSRCGIVRWSDRAVSTVRDAPCEVTPPFLKPAARNLRLPSRDASLTL